MRILVTGAAGRVGLAVRKELADAGFQLRLCDTRPIERPEGESLILDIADGEAVRCAMEGIEGVVHLAYGHGKQGDPVLSIQRNFDVNAKGTYNLLWAAKKAGVQRFVYTSTLSVFGSLICSSKTYLDETTPPHCEEVYGLTKFMGEEACALFGRWRQLSVVCLRLCNVVNESEWQETNKVRYEEERSRCWRAMATHVEDVARAIRLALVAPNIQYEIIHVAADNLGRLTDIRKAKELLGFWPKHRLDD